MRMGQYISYYLKVYQSWLGNYVSKLKILYIQHSYFYCSVKIVYKTVIFPPNCLPLSTCHCLAYKTLLMVECQLNSMHSFSFFSRCLSLSVSPFESLTIQLNSQRNYISTARREKFR